MKRYLLPISLAAVTLVMLLNACRSKATATPTPTTESLDAISTMAAQTAFFQLTQLALTQPPTPTPTDTPVLTPSATSALSTVTNPPRVVISSCANATFVKDVTIPDGTAMTVGQVFTKTWSETNSGNCPWTTSFKLVFLSGVQMGGVNANLPAQVNVGQTANLSVQLTVPNQTGTLTGWWVLVDDTGLRVGSAMSVVINVGAGTPTPTGTLTITPTGSLTNTSTRTPTPRPSTPTNTPTSTNPSPATDTPTKTSVPPTATPTKTPVAPTATPTSTPS